MADLTYKFEPLSSDLQLFVTIKCPDLSEDQIWRFAILLADSLKNPKEGPLNYEAVKTSFLTNGHRIFVHQGTIGINTVGSFPSTFGIGISLNYDEFLGTNSFRELKAFFTATINRAIVDFTAQKPD